MSKWRSGQQISPRQRRLNDFFGPSQMSSKQMNRRDSLLDVRAQAVRPVAAVSPMAGPSRKALLNDDDDDDFEDFSNLSYVKGKPKESVSLTKQVRKEAEELEEEAVQAVRKSTKRVIVSDDELDLEDEIEDSSPIKSQDDESKNELVIEEDFFQDNLFESDNEEEEEKPKVEPQSCQDTTATETVISNATQIGAQSQDFFDTPYAQTQPEYIDCGTLSPATPAFNAQAKGNISISSLTGLVPQGTCQASVTSVQNSGSSLEAMSVDQILKHPVLRVMELEEEDFSILSALKSSLLSITANLLMSLPVETLQEVRGYNITQHAKAVTAYKKITNCMKNYGLQKVNTSVNDTKSQTCANVSPLCLSPNEEHYRSSQQRLRNFYVENMNTGLNSSKLKDANKTMRPDLNRSSVKSETLKISPCKKLLDFSTPVRKPDNQAYLTCTESIPSSSSKAIPDVVKLSEIPGSATRNSFPLFYQANSSKSVKSQQTHPPRKFSFGSHRELASTSSNSSSPSHDSSSVLKTTNMTPLFSPSCISRTLITSATVCGSVNTSGLSKIKSSFHNGSDLAVKTSEPLGHLQSENSRSATTCPEKTVQHAGRDEFPPDDVTMDDLVEIPRHEGAQVRSIREQKEEPSIANKSVEGTSTGVPSKHINTWGNEEEDDDLDESVSLGSRAREVPCRERNSTVAGKEKIASDSSFIRDGKNYTSFVYKAPTKGGQVSPLKTSSEVRFYGNVKNDGVTGEFNGMNYPHSREMLKIFHQRFGLRRFRENQKEVINATLLGKDCFVLMPTGGGKSLCYQLPACVTEGVTIVISPLKSLMQDQVQKLASLDIAAGRLSGDISSQEENQIYMDLSRKQIALKLLYVTPEKISASQKFTDHLERLYNLQKLSRFVIDEAHCVSDWGHDFRPDYKKLSVLRKQFPGVPIMALTATATPRVRVDILHQLALSDDTKWFLSSFNRSNLRYQVLQKKGKKIADEVASLINSKYKNQSGIVYCLSRKECDNVSSDLVRCGIKAKSYHAGLADNQRSSIQTQWINDKIKVICATIAFGMGIDKPDVRFVIHYTIPKSIEGYYQESGRAGRDGDAADCVLFYNYPDMYRIRKMIEMDQENWQAKKNHFENLWRMVAFCENHADCRRSQVLNYFGEIFDRENCRRNTEMACDNCRHSMFSTKQNVAQEVYTILQTVKQLCTGGKWCNNFTLNHFVDIFKGSKLKKVLDNGHDRLPLHGLGKNFGRNDAERLFRRLILEGYLHEDLVVGKQDMTFAYLRPGQKCNKFLSTPESTFQFDVMSSRPSNQTAADSHSTTNEDNEMKEIERECYKALLGVVKEIAAVKMINYTNVINMIALRSMSKDLPETEEEMLKIPHVTKANYEKYGQALLDVTQRYAAQKLVLLSDRVEAKVEGNSVAGQNDSSNWADTISAPDPGASPYFASGATRGFRRGTKRKRNLSSGRGKGRGKRQGTASKRGANSSPTKRSRFAASRAKVAAAAARGGQVVRGPQQVKGRGSISSLLLQRPKQQTRQFLEQSRVVRF